MPRLFHPWWGRTECGRARAESGWEAPCYYANRFAQRACGLVGAPSGSLDGVMMFPECHSVHTFGMEFPIDVLLLDDDGHVLRSRRQVRPRRVVEDARATAVVERESSDEPWPDEGDVVLFRLPESLYALSSSS